MNRMEKDLQKEVIGREIEDVVFSEGTPDDEIVLEGIKLDNGVYIWLSGSGQIDEDVVWAELGGPYDDDEEPSAFDWLSKRLAEYRSERD